jgi:hypothetical protein
MQEPGGSARSEAGGGACDGARVLVFFSEEIPGLPGTRYTPDERATLGDAQYL